MRSRRRNAQLGAQGAEGAGGDGGEGEPLAEDGDLHEEEQEPGEGTQRAPAPERENVQPAPGLELIGQEMVVKPPGSVKGSAATRARPAGVGSGGDGAGREVAGKQVPGTSNSSLVQRRLWSTASRNPWATPGAAELQQGGDQDLREPAQQPESYGPLFTQEQLEYLKRWDRPGGLVNLGGDARSSVEAARIPAPGAASASGCGSGGWSISEAKRGGLHGVGDQAAHAGEQKVEGGKQLGGDLHDAGPAQRQGRGGRQAGVLGGDDSGRSSA